MWFSSSKAVTPLLSAIVISSRIQYCCFLANLCIVLGGGAFACVTFAVAQEMRDRSYLTQATIAWAWKLWELTNPRKCVEFPYQRSGFAFVSPNRVSPANLVVSQILEGKYMNCRYCRRDMRVTENSGPHSPLGYSSAMPVWTAITVYLFGIADIIASECGSRVGQLASDSVLQASLGRGDEELTPTGKALINVLENESRFL